MAEYSLYCRDAGVDCSYVMHGRSEEEVLDKAKEHAKEDHGVEEVTDEYLAAWRKKIKKE
ncbi:MAG: DUF1059 domain-containing protein [Pseudomonadota bacterium]